MRSPHLLRYRKPVALYKVYWLRVLLYLIRVKDIITPVHLAGGAPKNHFSSILYARAHIINRVSIDLSFCKNYDRSFLRPEFRIFCMHLFWKPINLGYFSGHLSMALGNKALNQDLDDGRGRVLLPCIDWCNQMSKFPKIGNANGR